MNKNKNSYIITYAIILVVVVASLLSLAATSLKPMQLANVKTEKMTAILNSIGEGGGVAEAVDKKAYIDVEYQKYIKEAFCVDSMGNKVEGADAFSALDNLSEVYAQKIAMPVFMAEIDGQRLYVLPTYGKGLWGPVWAYIALEGDCNRVYGAVFDHKSETPGLGAEIATTAFCEQFVGKQLFGDGEFKGIRLTKGVGSSAGNPYAVDGISGGTLTGNGVTKMLLDCLGDYVPFFQKVQMENQETAAVEVVENQVEIIEVQ